MTKFLFTTVIASFLAIAGYGQIGLQSGNASNGNTPVIYTFPEAGMFDVGDATKSAQKPDDEILFPNSAGKNSMTPTAWSGSAPFIFAGIGGCWPQPYSDEINFKDGSKPVDLITVLGIGAGNPRKHVNVAAAININDVSKFSNPSYNVIVSRWIGKSSSISLSGMNLLATEKNDADASIYAAFSHAVQKIPAITPGRARLSYTIGFGTGRFLMKSPMDIDHGKGKYGTGVFANVTYEVIKNLNLGLEWSGLNLGVVVGYKPFPKLPGINIGVVDLTPNSGTPRLAFSTSYAYSLQPLCNKMCNKDKVKKNDAALKSDNEKTAKIKDTVSKKDKKPHKDKSKLAANDKAKKDSVNAKAKPAETTTIVAQSNPNDDNKKAANTDVNPGAGNTNNSAVVTPANTNKVTNVNTNTNPGNNTNPAISTPANTDVNQNAGNTNNSAVVTPANTNQGSNVNTNTNPGNNTNPAGSTPANTDAGSNAGVNKSSSNTNPGTIADPNTAVANTANPNVAATNVQATATSPANSVSEVKKYFIITGSYLFKKNARNALDKLKAEGYSSAEIAGLSFIGSTRVSVSGFVTMEEAKKELEVIRAKFSPQAWILEKR